jgi:hypothetical protein
VIKPEIAFQFERIIRCIEYGNADENSSFELRDAFFRICNSLGGQPHVLSPSRPLNVVITYVLALALARGGNT